MTKCRKARHCNAMHRGLSNTTQARMTSEGLPWVDMIVCKLSYNHKQQPRDHGGSPAYPVV
eukprot:2910441-Amphidinium_carterae.1